MCVPTSFEYAMVVSGDPDAICYLGVLGNSYLYQRLQFVQPRKVDPQAWSLVLVAWYKGRREYLRNFCSEETVIVFSQKRPLVAFITYSS